MRSIAPPHPTTYHAKILGADRVSGLQAAQDAEVRSAEYILARARNNLRAAEGALLEAEARLARVRGGK